MYRFYRRAPHFLRAFIILNAFLFTNYLQGQVSSSFELRYFTRDKSANGLTDFKGEQEYFDTVERIDFLNVYADVASRWYNDTMLDRRVVPKAEVNRFLAGLKSKPLPETRKRISLEEWKYAGYPQGQDTERNKRMEQWQSYEGTEISDGTFRVLDPLTRITIDIDTLSWRFHLWWKVKAERARVPHTLSILQGKKTLLEAGLHANGNLFYTDGGADRMAGTFDLNQWYTLRLEVDLKNGRYSFYEGERLAGDWVLLNGKGPVTQIRLSGGTGITLDEIRGLAFDTKGTWPNKPFTIRPFINESFSSAISTHGWARPEYDDEKWNSGVLPIVRGGVLEAGEDLYLRKKVRVDPFDKAWLNIETLDPGGEVWINGQVVYVEHTRHPIRLDVSSFLNPYKDNTIAIRVYHFYNDGPLYHSPDDRNIGWFCGRAWLDLTGGTTIEEAKVYTQAIEKDARQYHAVLIKNHADSTFSGELRITYTPWYPEEQFSPEAEFRVPIRIFAHDTAHFRHMGQLEWPRLWTHDSPNLYKVRFQLIADGTVMDDEVVTTGIRTVSQEGGTFRINGKPELLGGAQTMGFRMPIENIARHNRCAPAEVLAEELLACKELGNTLRIHVHAGGKYAYSVNDPRVAEMADQLGLMLIWPTASWIREGEWGGIDFEGYPKYMSQVFNHPSIVIWEGSNHPNRFGGKPLDYSNRFVSKIYQTIAGTDTSRLIAPSSYNRHFAYRNDSGTIDDEGNAIVPAAEWTAPLLVRGNQDALMGYGAQWHNIRQWPDPYRQSLLDSPNHAYINFEHEESIGMQNFLLARGKPWFEMPSYENPYDVGSIGREFDYDEFRASQAWQAFGAWEAMKWQRLKDVDGFSWCCLHGGPNSGTYRKPLIDALGHAKLAFYTNKSILQDVVAGSDNPDVVYGKKDLLTPVIMNVGAERIVNLKVQVKDLSGKILETREYTDVILEEGRTVKKLPPFRPKFGEEGYYIIEYLLRTA